MAGARHSSQRAQIQRQQHAEAAARLLASNEARDIDSARRKAAARVGASSKAQWPSDDEVRAALDAHQRLFAGDAQRQRRQQRRAIAIEALRFFVDFQPRIVAESVDVATHDGAAIELLVQEDSPESLAHHLAEHGIAYEQPRRNLYRVGTADAAPMAVDCLQFLAGDAVVRIYPLSTERSRQAWSRSRHGTALTLMGLTALQALIDDDDAP